MVSGTLRIAMTSVAPLRSRAFWILAGRSAVIGIFGGVFAVAFIGVEHALTGLVWGQTGGYEWFGGGLRALVVPIAAGALVGLIYLVLGLPRRLHSFIEELEEGRTDPGTAPGAVLVALVSLVGGASLGPEAPLVTGAAGFANWLTERVSASPEDTRTATLSAAAGVFGGLMSSPLIGALLALELEHDQDLPFFFRHIIPGGVSGTIGFLIVYPVLGAPFLGLYRFPPFEFSAWYLAAGAAMGVVGAIVGLSIGLVAKIVGRVVGRLPASPVARAAIGGCVLGAVGFMMPATLFSGVDTLGAVVADPAEIGVGLLLAVVALKMVTLTTSLRTGFYGGPFFPMFFIGGSVGAVLHLLFPAVPLALAVGATMAATGAMASIPLSVAVLGAFVVGVGPPAAAVISIAVIVAFSIGYGLGFVGPWSSAAAEPGPS